MAINWRRRAPVVRVLAAVYTELGEEAFERLYGRIVQHYGKEATYNSIKLFFVDEVAKTAEELKNTNQSNGQNCGQSGCRQRLGLSTQLPRVEIDDSDDEIVVVSERALQKQQRQRQQVQACQQERVVIEGNVRSEREISLPTPRPEANIKRLSTSKKRRYSTFQEDDHQPATFGYVTNQGKHRCLLCMTELKNLELLRKHESMSRLHLANLKDPDVLSRGYTMLAQVYSLSHATFASRSRDDTEPLMSGGLNEWDGTMSRGHTVDRDAARTGMRTGHDLRNGAVSSVDISLPEETHRAGRNDLEDRQDQAGPSSNLQYPESDYRTPRAQTLPADPVTYLRNIPDQEVLGSRQIPSKTLNAVIDLDEDLGNMRSTARVQILLSRAMEVLAKQSAEEHLTSRGDSKRMRTTQDDIREGESKRYNREE